MRTMPAREPERWTDRARRGGALEDALGAALLRARAATEPSEGTLARVEAGLPFRAPASRAGFRWRVALAALGGLLTLGGTVRATRGPLLAWVTRHRLSSARAPSPGVRARPFPPPAARAAREAVSATVDLASAPTPAPAPVAEPGAVVAAVPASRNRRSPRRDPARPELAVAAEPEVAAPAAEEARLLEGVFRALRSGGAVGDAVLASLDDYDRRFPSGLLRAEARLARAEALLALGRDVEALAIFDAYEAEGARLTRAARVVRAELRAEVGRCADAGADFAAVLLVSARDELGARALYGRASCALRTGDAATAVAALTSYLERQPDGAHAAEARAALARLREQPRSP